MVQSKLKTLYEAVEQDNTERTVELTDEVLKTFKERRATNEAVDKTADSVRSATDDEALASTAESVMVARTKANEATILVNRALLTYLQSEGGQSKLLEEIDNAIDAFNTLDSQFAQLRAGAEEIELPTIISLVTPDQIVVPLGTRPESAISVRNDGNSVTDQVELELESDLEVALSPSTIEELDADESETIGFDDAPTTAGSFDATIIASINETEEIVDSTSVYIRVEDKSTYLKRALGDLTNLYEDLAIAGAAVQNEDDEDRVVPSGIDEKVRNVTKQTIDLIAKVGENNQSRGRNNGQGQGQNNGQGQEKSLDNQIGSVINMLGALENQINAQSGKQFTESDASRLRHDTQLIASVYESAQNAQM